LGGGCGRVCRTNAPFPRDQTGRLFRWGRGGCRSHAVLSWARPVGDVWGALRFLEGHRMPPPAISHTQTLSEDHGKPTPSLYPHGTKVAQENPPVPENASGDPRAPFPPAHPPHAYGHTHTPMTGPWALQTSKTNPVSPGAVPPIGVSVQFTVRTRGSQGQRLRCARPSQKKRRLVRTSETVGTNEGTLQPPLSPWGPPPVPCGPTLVPSGIPLVPWWCPPGC